jgi:hypothetical protein
MVLFLFSSIRLAAVMLVGVALYAVLASVPVGLLALIPTWLIYIATLVIASVVPGLFTGLGCKRAVSSKQLGRSAAFLMTAIPMLLVAAAGVVLWINFVWPVVSYDHASGEGLRLFGGFVETYGSTTVRRLPAFEMTELEFYAWWPMRAMLMIFTINLVVATIRRIEFKFVNLGVLTVHTGIVMIAIGSVYYQMFKQEGDSLLLAGGAMQGHVGTGPGPAQAAFYDREDPALWIHAGMDWHQRRMPGLPRYNDYNLSAGKGQTVNAVVNESIDHSHNGESEAHPHAPESLGPISIPLDTGGSETGLGDIALRVVGFASYAEGVKEWQQVDPPRPADQRTPRQFVYIVNHTDQETGNRNDEGVRAFWFAFTPNDPEHGMQDLPEIGIEYAQGMDETRWSDLGEEIPQGAPYGFVVEIPEAGFKEVMAPATGARTALGDTGWHMTIQQTAEKPPFPIVTPGYEGATSSVAFVRLEPPTGEPFVRWVYHRFPEISQDLLEGESADGRPMRRDPDPSIRVGYIDASKFQVYFNENAETGEIDSIVRTSMNLVKRGGLQQGQRLEEPVPMLSFDIAERWDDARQFEAPEPVHADAQDGNFVGTHDKAMIAVEVSQPGLDWKEIVWLPFCKFTDVGSLRASTQRAVTLPDGGQISLVFGRVQHRLPGFQLRMLDFTMLSYDHRGSPRDYQSLVRVEPTAGGFGAYDHVTRLNAPLKAPFQWSSRRGFASNLYGEIMSHLSPTQFKFSQAGWDRSGWEQSQLLVDQGVMERPRANFTILGVGNNPGIHVIALGGVLMGVGTPWAFYVKPWLVRRQKRKIQSLLAQQAAKPEGEVPA